MKKLFTMGIGVVAVVIMGTAAISISPDKDVSTEVASTLPPDPNWIVAPSSGA